MALITLVLLPLLGGLALVAGGRGLAAPVATRVAAALAVVTFLLAVVVAITRPAVDRSWLPELGVRAHLGIDGISVPLILLTALVGVLVTIHAMGEVPAGGSPSTLVGSLLLVVGGALATFTARDIVLFFLAFELVLIPMWVLIRRFGDPHHPGARAEAGHRFVLYTAVGSTLMLVGILLLVASAGSTDLGRLVEAGAALPHGRQLTIALLLVTGLAVKVPVFPLHTWLPSAHTIAPTAGSVLLAAILLKMGTYGLVRLPLALVPSGFAALAPWLAIAGVVGIVWGSLVCLVERDLKRLIAYSSVAHMGFVVLGLSTGTVAGLQAALYGNLAHGVISALLFVVVGGLKRRWGSVDLRRSWPALREIAPRRGFALILGLAAALGLPGLAGFWGEFLAILAAWRPADVTQIPVFRTVAVIAAIGGALAAAYALRVARLLWVGDAVELADPAGVADAVEAVDPSGDGDGDSGQRGTGEGLDVEARGVEWMALSALGLATVLLGVLPWLVLGVMDPAVTALLGGAR